MGRRRSLTSSCEGNNTTTNGCGLHDISVSPNIVRVFFGTGLVSFGEMFRALLLVAGAATSAAGGQVTNATLLTRVPMIMTHDAGSGYREPALRCVGHAAHPPTILTFPWACGRVCEHPILVGARQSCRLAAFHRPGMGILC